MLKLSLILALLAPQDDDPEAKVRRSLRDWRPKDVADTSKLSLNQKIAALVPTDKEDKWLKIPWRTDILKARREAAEKGKPVFLWLMDGDPMVCV